MRYFIITIEYDDHMCIKKLNSMYFSFPSESKKKKTEWEMVMDHTKISAYNLSKNYLPLRIYGTGGQEWRTFFFWSKYLAYFLFFFAVNICLLRNHDFCCELTLLFKFLSCSSLFMNPKSKILFTKDSNKESGLVEWDQLFEWYSSTAWFLGLLHSWRQ